MFLSVIESAFALVGLGLSAPTALLVIQVIAGLRSNASAAPAEGPSASLAILVPAHDEERGLARTLASIRSQLRQSDRLLVVADNCSDETAAIAKASGAEVAVRHDPSRRGKGFALAFGLEHLAVDPPEVVIILDADCVVAPAAVSHLAAAALRYKRPVQACYLIQASEQQRNQLGPSEFTFFIKNCIRLRGLSRLGLPCHLTGSGMAFSWSILSDTQLAGNHLVEDMKLGLDCAMAGRGAVFCDDARVFSAFPSSRSGQESQRYRWEKGRSMLVVDCVKILLRPSSYRRLGVLVLALDTLTPPVTLFALILVGHLLAIFLWSAFTQAAWMPLLALLNLSVLIISIGCVWMLHGQEMMPLRTLPGLVKQLSLRLKLYLLLARADRIGWVRTDRSVGN